MQLQLKGIVHNAKSLSLGYEIRGTATISTKQDKTLLVNVATFINCAIQRMFNLFWNLLFL